jgi:hypothetical protein
MKDFDKTTHEAFETMRIMNEKVLNRLDGLPTALNAIVQRTVSNAIREALLQIHHVSKALESKSQVSIHEMSPSQGNNTSASGIELHDRMGVDTPAKTLKPKRYIRTISLAFATITIRTVEQTTQELLVSPADGEHRLHESTTNRIMIDIRFHPRITQKAFLLWVKNQLPGLLLSSDMRLRTYSCASNKSPVGIACKQANITAMRALFVTGRASPHDVLITNFRHTHLIDYSWAHWRGSIRALDKYYNSGTENESYFQQIIDEIRQHFEMFRFLADCGVDVGERRYKAYSTPRLFHLLDDVRSSHPDAAPYFVEMSRLILERAIENPMEIRKGRERRYEKLIYIGSDMFPDIGACI